MEMWGIYALKSLVEAAINTHSMVILVGYFCFCSELIVVFGSPSVVVLRGGEGAEGGVGTPNRPAGACNADVIFTAPLANRT